MDGYVCLAIANEESGNSLQASKVIDSAIQYAEKLNDPAADAALASGQARLNLLRGNQSEAEEWLARTKEAPLNPTMFFWVEIPSITRCRVMISRGSEEDLTTAIQLLEDYRAYSRSVFNKMREIDILVLKVLALKKLGLEEDALNALKNAIELSAAGRWVRPFAEQINDISYLLKKISELGIHPRFIGLIFDSVEKSKALSAQVKGLVKTKSQNGKEKVVELTPKEREVLQYVAKGLRNQEIADVLFNSQDTIKRHIYNMFQKFNVKNRLSLVTKAKEEGMLKE